jgi:putative hemolysin
LEVPEPGLLLLAVGLCLLALAFTSAVDAAFTTLSRHRLYALLKDRRPRTQRAMAILVDDPDRFKTTLLVLHNSLIITATGLTLGATWADGYLVVAGAIAALLMALLVVGDLVPRALATRNPATMAARLAGPMAALCLLIMPLTFALSLLFHPLYRLLSGQETPTAPLVTEDELRLLVNAGEEEGLIEHDERAMIEGVIAFGDTLLREIMVPRVDIVAIDHDASIAQALDLVSASGYSRIPVYAETVDHVVGIIYAKDLIPALRDGAYNLPITSLLRSAHFVPETMKVNVLLQDLQRRKVHMAIIVDEYGGTAGLATIEDMIEEIVGEIQDEYDTEEPSLQTVGDGVYIVDARMPIHDLNDLLDLDLRSEAAERVGGLIYERLARVPRVGDEVELPGALATVLAIKGVRAMRLRIVCQPQPAIIRPAHLRELAEGELRGSV